MSFIYNKFSCCFNINKIADASESAFKIFSNINVNFIKTKKDSFKNPFLKLLTISLFQVAMFW